ncbi:hypothetical protein R1flu_004718 [Riccia fluitans]|uniref:Protein EXORDIUM-like n=1 Tax=Riccia fluitans TaxID=41844 RepID=A0ABD1YS29_9MARC
MAFLDGYKYAAFLSFVAFTVFSTSVADNASSHSTAFLHPESKFRQVRKFHPVRKTGGFSYSPEPTVALDYHFGPVMTGRNDVIKMFVIYYGHFSRKQKRVLSHFFKSFSQNETQELHKPTTEKWWGLTRQYVDLYETPVAARLVYEGEKSNNYSLGASLNQSDIQTLVVKSLESFGASSRSMYLVLTSEDVLVERFCQNVCGTHFFTFPSDATNDQMLPYAWIGNPAKQCPEICAWPYAPGGFLKEGLIPPNGDAGIDGMIITVANLLAAMGTNPFGNGYYREDGLAAAAVCQGVYGDKAYSGYPGNLLVDKSTNASFNVYGYKDSKFLVPFMWDPATQQCALQA